MDVPSADLISAAIGLSDLRGTAMADAPLSFFPSQGRTFTILSTGLAGQAGDLDQNNEEELGIGVPFDDVSFILDGLDNSANQDLVQLTLVLKPPSGKTSLSFDFAFYSEEFPDYIGNVYNDVFVAELAADPFSSELEVVDTQITAPKNIALDPQHDLISVNAAFGFDPQNPNPDTGTTYDGTSGLLRATGCLPAERPTGNVVLVLSITDVGDSQLDSAVFLDNFQWGNPDDCRSGVEQASIQLTPKLATRPVGANHTVTARVFDTQNQPLPDQLVGLTVTGANPAAGQLRTDSQGQVSFTYQGVNQGDDTITAWVDQDEDNLQNTGEPFSTARVQWQAGRGLTIVKEVAGFEGEARFHFTGDLPNFDLAAGEKITFPDLSPGNYIVIETDLPDPYWNLLWVQCNDEFLPVTTFTDPPGQGTVITIEPDRLTECVFHNERSTYLEEDGPAKIYLPFILK